jgi:hypothetical protein
MRLTKKRSSTTTGWVRTNWSGWWPTSITLAGWPGRVFRAFGRGVEFYRAPRKPRQ